MYTNLEKELQTIYQNTVQYLHQLKARITSLINEKLNQFEGDLIRQMFIEYVRDMQREIALFTQISEDLDIKESYDQFKDQIRNKINQLNDVELQCGNLTLNGKMISVNPLLFIKQQPQMVLQSQVKVEKAEPVSKQYHRFKLINYLCPICQLKFTSSFAARAHLKYTHSVPKALSCPHCELLFNHSSDLARHITIKHTKSQEHNLINIYQCTFTGKKLRTKREIELCIAQEQGYLITISKINQYAKQEQEDNNFDSPGGY